MAPKKAKSTPVNLDIFLSDTDRWHIAWLNQTGPDDWCVYADGYKRAADLLVENLETTYDVNTVVYPIMFLYRQYIELTLKEIIAYGNYLNEQSNTGRVSHDLEALWPECRSVIEKHLPEVTAKDVQKIERLVEKFSELDPTSTTFRYPAKRDGKSSFPYNLGPINLRQTAEAMKEFSSLLEPVTGMLSVCKDFKRQFRSACGTGF